MMASKSGAKYVTYQDIADALGITKMAVSKALRDSPDISEETKKSVREKADELGYIPNNLAANLKRKKTNMIVVVFNSFHNPYFSIACYKIFDAVRKTEYLSQLFFCSKNVLDVDDVKELMINKYCGVVSFVEPTESAAAFFRKMGIPFVLVGIHTKAKGIDCVYTDDYLGGGLVGEYFLENGFKKALYASDRLSETSDRRAGGFIDAVKRAGRESAALHCGRPDEMARLACDKIIADKFDFVFCFSDSFAITLLLELEGRGAADGVTVFGYDNLHKYYPIIREVNSVDSNLDCIIEYSCGLIISKIEGEIPADEKVAKVFGVTLAAGKRRGA